MNDAMLQHFLADMSALRRQVDEQSLFASLEATLRRCFGADNVTVMVYDSQRKPHTVIDSAGDLSFWDNFWHDESSQGFLHLVYEVTGPTEFHAERLNTELKDLRGKPVTLPNLLILPFPMTSEPGGHIILRNPQDWRRSEAERSILAALLDVAHAEFQYQRRIHQLEMRERLAVLSEFAAAMVHELRNPLTTIRGMTDLLERRRHDEAFLDRFVPQVQEASTRLSEMLDGMLYFLRDHQEGVQDVSLTKLLDGVRELLGPQAQRLKIKLSVEQTPETVILHAHYGQLLEVIINLVRRAFRALSGADDQGTIQIKATADYTQTDAWAIIAIEDNGEPMPEALRQEVRHPIRRNSLRDQDPGLTVSYRLTQVHGGQIDVGLSELGGTRFKVRLPCRIVESYPRA